MYGLFFFFNDTATTEIYTLSLHDALPISDRTEANPNELNQDDARYGFRCCHLKNIWTAPLPPETELSRQMTTSTTSIDIMGLQAATETITSIILIKIGRAVQQECRDRSRM